VINECQGDEKSALLPGWFSVYETSSRFQRRHVVLFEDIDIDSNTSSFWIKSRGSNQWSHFNQHVSFPRAFIVVKANGLLVSAPTGHGQTSTTLPDISESKTFSI